LQTGSFYYVQHTHQCSETVSGLVRGEGEVGAATE
jgi:hypothetical protein